MNKNLLVLPGDGIGKDVCDAALPIIDALNLPISISFGDVGWTCWENHGDSVPQDTWLKIKNADAVLLGAITSKGKIAAQEALPAELKGKDIKYVSPVIQLRQKLGLFANIRPVRYVDGNLRPFDLCIIRENTEGLYSGFDFKGIPEEMVDWLKHPNISHSGSENVAWSVRLQTKFGLERLFKTAFEYAEKHNLKRVTFADKPNVMRESGAFAKEIFDSIASEYPLIEADIHNVDAVALWLVTRPHTFGVIVAENMFGDILSDLAAGVMGGLGLAPSANIGSDIAYFEPVHGSAPSMAGKNKANPSAMFYTIALMLDYLGFSEEAKLIENATDSVIREGKVVTYDLGGEATTTKMALTIIEKVTKLVNRKTATVITVGDELLTGENNNLNLQLFSNYLYENGLQVKKHIVVADDIKQIYQSVIESLGASDLIVVSGGLGPTSDDKTRYAIAKAANKPLKFDEATWTKIEKQLISFGVRVDNSNKIQATFPEGAKILANETGTAPGFAIHCDASQLIVLPGPPKQACKILKNYIENSSLSQISNDTKYHWTLIGISEGEIGQIFNQFFPPEDFEVHFLWKSPYVQVELKLNHFQLMKLESLEKIEEVLQPYIVSRKREKASDILKKVASIKWEFEDPSLSKYLSSSNTETASHAVNVEIEPKLNVILEGDRPIGQMTMTTSISKQKQLKVMFPYNKDVIEHILEEYASWSVLKMLEKSEK